jgi:hypothetical protein
MTPGSFRRTKSKRLAASVKLNWPSRPILISEIVTIFGAPSEIFDSIRARGAIKLPSLLLQFGMVH